MATVSVPAPSLVTVPAPVRFVASVCGRPLLIVTFASLVTLPTRLPLVEPSPSWRVPSLTRKEPPVWVMLPVIVSTPAPVLRILGVPPMVPVPDRV